MAVLQLGAWIPEVELAAWIAPGAMVVGRVSLQEGVSVWFNAVIRGDLADINVGAGSNIQDGCILHVDDGYPLTLGEAVTVGHGAILHGCTIEDDVLVGMGATILNGARIGRGSLVAAGALVREGEEIPPFSLVAGVPAGVKKTMVEADTLERHRRSADHYRSGAAEYRRNLIDS